MAENDSDAGGPKPPANHIDEEHNLEEGQRARRELGIATARAALADPRSVDPKRLRRLGQDGMAAFLAELRGHLPGRERRGLVPAARSRVAREPDATSPIPAVPSRSAGPSSNPTARKAKPARPLHPVEGWWKRPPKPAFERTAFRQGLILGAFLILALVHAFLLSGH